MAGEIKLPDITSRVKLDTSDVNDAVGRTGSALKSMAGAFVGVGAAIGAGKFLKGAYEEAEEARKSIAQTNAVIASTGGIANVTAKDVDALSGSLSAKTAIDDEAIASGANLLLTFTNVRNEVGKGNNVFDQATEAALDMSVAMGTDMKSASILVGKALNDPVKGVTALTKSGVQFTAQQKEQIKTLVESGRSLDAQKIILKELTTQFGGSAAAAASPMAKLKVAFDNLKETVGTALMPALSAVATFLASNLPAAIEMGKRAFATVKAAIMPVIDAFKLFIGSISGAGANVDLGKWTNPIIDAGARVRAVFDAITAAIKLFVVGFQNPEIGVAVDSWQGAIVRFGQVANTVFGWIKENAMPIIVALGVTLGLIVSPIGVLVAALVYAYTQFEGFRNVVQAVVGFLTDTVIPGIVSFASFIADQFGKLSAWTREHWGSIQEAIGHVIAAVRAVIETFVSVIQAVWQAWGDELMNIVGIVWDQIRNVIETVVGIIQGIIEAGLAIINGDWGKAWDAIKEILSTAWEFIRETVVNALRLLREVIEGAISGIVAFMGEVPGKIVGALGDLGSLLIEAGKAVMRGLKDGIVAGFEAVKNFVGGIAGKIADLKGPLDYDKRLLIPAGQAIMQSLVQGLRDKESELVRELARITAMIEAVGQVTGSGLQDSLRPSAASAGASYDALATQIRPPVSRDAFIANDQRDPNAGRPGYIQSDNGSWRPDGPPIIQTVIMMDKKVVAQAASEGQYKARRP